MPLLLLAREHHSALSKYSMKKSFYLQREIFVVMMMKECNKNKENSTSSISGG